MAFKLKSGNKTSFKNMGSPTKHGTTDDFLYGENGHNPDIMEGKHEDWHTDKIEAEKKKPSPGKHYVDDVKGHNDGHPDDLQTPEEHEKGKVESPVKQGTDMSKLRSKQRRSSKGISEHQHFSDPKSQGDEPIVEGTWGGKKKGYEYKINGKKVSKAEYIKYQNKPGGDEPGKQTNDPDASGNKAKIAKDRAKLNK